MKNSITKTRWHILEAAQRSEMHRNDASHPEYGFGRMLPPPVQEPAIYTMQYRQF